MKRREFMALVGGAAAATLREPAHGQQVRFPVVGFLSSGLSQSKSTLSFLQGLAEYGYFEGTNVSVEYRGAEGYFDQLPTLAADLVRRRVAVIAASVLPAVLAAKGATQSIPIVFVIGSDPVEMGLVASLNRPGGNLTGFTVLEIEFVAKRLELLHELVPAAASIALLVNPANPRGADAQTKQAQIAARTIGLGLLVLKASTPSDMEAAFRSLAQQDAGALLVGGDTFFSTSRDQIVTLAARYAVPVIYFDRDFVAAGGLMSYGGAASDAFRQAGIYAGRILKGERPTDLPVQQSTKVELTINLRTAKALGITVPLTLLGRADEVIE